MKCNKGKIITEKVTCPHIDFYDGNERAKANLQYWIPIEMCGFASYYFQEKFSETTPVWEGGGGISIVV